MVVQWAVEAWGCLRGAEMRGDKTKHWIQGAIKHPGAFKASAEKAGMSTHAYAEKEKGASGTTGRRARLALTLMGMHHG